MDSRGELWKTAETEYRMDETHWFCFFNDFKLNVLNITVHLQFCFGVYVPSHLFSSSLQFTVNTSSVYASDRNAKKDGDYAARVQDIKRKKYGNCSFVYALQIMFSPRENIIQSDYFESVSVCVSAGGGSIESLKNTTKM